MPPRRLRIYSTTNEDHGRSCWDPRWWDRWWWYEVYEPDPEGSGRILVQGVRLTWFDALHAGRAQLRAWNNHPPKDNP